MFVLMQYTYNSQGKMTDAEPLGVFTTRDPVQSELEVIAAKYREGDRDFVFTWNDTEEYANSLTVKFYDGLKREFMFVVEQVELKA